MYHSREIKSGLSSLPWGSDEIGFCCGTNGADTVVAGRPMQTRRAVYDTSQPTSCSDECFPGRRKYFAIGNFCLKGIKPPRRSWGCNPEQTGIH
jgi:hypothetical protein